MGKLPSKKDLLSQLDEERFARIPGLLSDSQCQTLIAQYGDDNLFRSTINMARYSFGRGEYRYFNYPLPATVQMLRETLFPVVADVANEFEKRLNQTTVWPRNHEALIKQCRANDQVRPTALLLKYVQGDYNCLHQDLYGDVHFPLQVIIPLSDSQIDYSGGELVLVENRPRLQSRAIVVPVVKGDGIVIPVRDIPRKTNKGWSKSQIRHGVSRVHRGVRHTLGIIFHDAT